MRSSWIFPLCNEMETKCEWQGNSGFRRKSFQSGTTITFSLGSLLAEGHHSIRVDLGNLMTLILSEFIFTIKGLSLSVTMHFAFIRRWGLYYPWKIDKKLPKRVQVFPVAVCFLRDFSNTTVFLLFPNDMKWVVQIPSTACWVSALARSLWKGVSVETGQYL